MGVVSEEQTNGVPEMERSCIAMTRVGFKAAAHMRCRIRDAGFVSEFVACMHVILEMLRSSSDNARTTLKLQMECRFPHGKREVGTGITQTVNYAMASPSIQLCRRPKRWERPVVTAPIARERECCKTAPVLVRSGTRVVCAHVLSRRVVLVGDHGV